ncbi:MAG: NAD(P)H-dependent oxidoreductase [Clostridiales bacterium]|nr:NAD(P)H-dependent oxidoreductase [Clostridiales bacterium]
MVGRLSTAVVAVLFNNILMRLAGSIGVASITIILYTQGILASIFTGYSIGIAPVISYNYGKQDTERLKKIYSISLKVILATSIVFLALSQLSAGLLVNVFAQKETEIYKMALRGFRIFSFSFLFMGFNGFSSAMFTALNDGKVSAILSFCCGCGVCNDRKKACSQNDDMTEIIEKMIAADVIVMATPVYFYTMCGQMKTLIDRTCAAYTKLTNKEFYFILTAAESDKNIMETTVAEFRSFTYSLPPKSDVFICARGLF